MSSLKMSSKHSVKARAKAKTMEFRRKWLKDKVDSAKDTYNETLAAFKERLDNIVAEAFSHAARLMEETNEDTFLKEVSNVGIQLEKCNNDLFDLNLMCCSLDSDSSDCGDEHDSEVLTEEVKPATETFPKCSSSGNRSPAIPSPELKEKKDVEIYESSSSNNSSNVDLSPQAEPSTQSAVETCLNHPTTSTPVVPATPLPLSASAVSTPTIFKPIPSTSTESGGDLSPCYENIPFTGKSSPIVEQTSLTKVLKSAALSSLESIPSPSMRESPTSSRPSEHFLGDLCDSQLIQSSEIDLLLLHNIQLNKKVELLVTDVKDPSYFSVQPVECHDQVVGMQQAINEMYSKEWPSNLCFSASPKVGTVCIALFSDQYWYRAKVMRKLKDEKYEIMYIDYGNHYVMEEKDLRIMTPHFANIPKMSIQCSLHGVEPAACLGASSSNDVKWTTNCTHWFDSHVYNKRFVGKFADAPAEAVSDPVYHLNLFAVNRSSDGEESIWNIAEGLVCMGFGNYTEKPVEFHNTSKPADLALDKRSSPFDIVSSDCQKNETPSSKTSFPDYRSLVDVKPTARKDKVYNAVPAGMESSSGPGRNNHRKVTVDLLDGARRVNSKSRGRSRNEVRQAQLKEDPAPTLSSISSDIQRTSSDYAVEDPVNGDLATWNPMREDFVSERNRYSIDVDSACVAVENFDPSKVNSCKHFEKGDCWKGINCDKPHVKPAKGVLYHAQVLSGHMLDEVELKSDEKVIIKVTTTPKDEDFYVQVISKDFSKSDLSTQRSGIELDSITDDMKRFYSKNRAKLSFDGALCVGEMCAVVSDRVFCRAVISKISETNQRVQIFLVDYGNKMWTNSHDLLPLSLAFMHAPAQAILCTYDKMTCAVTPVKSHCYLARVGNVTTIVDSPVPLTFLTEI